MSDFLPFKVGDKIRFRPKEKNRDLHTKVFYDRVFTVTGIEPSAARDKWMVAVAEPTFLEDTNRRNLQWYAHRFVLARPRVFIDPKIGEEMI